MNTNRTTFKILPNDIRREIRSHMNPETKRQFNATSKGQYQTRLSELNNRYINRRMRNLGHQLENEKEQLRILGNNNYNNNLFNPNQYGYILNNIVGYTPDMPYDEYIKLKKNRIKELENGIKKLEQDLNTSNGLMRQIQPNYNSVN
tara:strand:+ start:3668 stop:4108 length:441 start_codon:yes stop_codon:yes gene_type:complete